MTNPTEVPERVQRLKSASGKLKQVRTTKKRKPRPFTYVPRNRAHERATRYQPADRIFTRLCHDILLAKRVNSDLARQFERAAFKHLAAYADAAAFTSKLRDWDTQVDN
jgi:hypothetical protein